jgi:CheY-specific phosphatase CheX
MFFTAVLGFEPVDSLPGPESGTDVAMTFSIRFDGDISGRFGLHLQQNTARNLAANFLGEAEADVSPAEIGEVIGELTNMLCGSVMSRVEGKHSFALSPPRPSSITSPDNSESMAVSKLEIESGVVTIWIAIEGNTCPF